MKQLNFILLAISVAAAATCREAGSQPPVPQAQSVLVTKIFREGQLRAQYFYGEDHRIDSIHYYDPKGRITRRDIIFLNGEGKVGEIVTRFHYTSNVHTQENTYDGDKKVLGITYVDDGTGKKESFRYTYEYPDDHTVVLTVSNRETIHRDDNKTLTFQLDAEGNQVEQQTDFAENDSFNFSQEYTFDDGISTEYLVETNIPGYYSEPVGKNNVLSSRKFDENGRLQPSFSSSYTYKYDARGYLSKQVLQNAAGSEEAVYTFEYLRNE